MGVKGIRKKTLEFSKSDLSYHFKSPTQCTCLQLSWCNHSTPELLIYLQGCNLVQRCTRSAQEVGELRWAKVSLFKWTEVLVGIDPYWKNEPTTRLNKLLGIARLLGKPGAERHLGECPSLSTWEETSSFRAPAICDYSPLTSPSRSLASLHFLASDLMV